MKNSLWLVCLVMSLLWCTELLAQSDPEKVLQLRVRHPHTDTIEEPVRRVIENAIQQWRQVEAVSKINEERADAYTQLGKVYLAHHFYLAAADALGVAVALVPDQATAHYFRGVALAEAHDTELAILALTDALKYQDLPEAHYQRAALLLKGSEYSVASGDIDTLMSRVGEDTGIDEANIFALAAKLALLQSRYQAAADFYREALTLQPQADSLYRPMALALREMGQIEEAQDAFAKSGSTAPVYQDRLMVQVKTLSRSTQDYIDRGQALMRQRKFTKAVEQFAMAVDLGPSNAQAHVTYGRGLEVIGQFDQARAHYERAIYLQPEFPVAHYFLGAFLERQENHVLAREHYKIAVTQDPEYLPPRVLLAHSLFRDRQFNDARAHYQRIADANKRNIQAYFYYGLASLALQDCDLAIEAFERGVRINTNYSPLFETLARSYAICTDDQDKLSKARTIAEQLMKTRPDSSSSQTLAMVYAAQQDYASAISLQSRAIVSNTSQPPAKLRDTLARYQSGSRALTAWSLDDEIYFPPPLTRGSSE